MSTIVTRAGKGSPLTNNEMDANLNNLNGDKSEISTTVVKDSSVGAAQMPVGTAAQRPVVPVKGQFRYNDDLAAFEGYTEGVGWDRVGGADSVSQGDLQSGVVGKGPAFIYTLNPAQNVTSGIFTKVICQTDVIHSLTGYNPITGRFQPSVAGYYQISGVVSITITPTAMRLVLYKNGSTHRMLADARSPTANASVSGSTLVFLNGSTDYVEMWVRLDDTQNLGVGEALTNFSAVLVRSA